MASTGEVWKLGHRPALDGVRGIAILLVLVHHTVGDAVPWLNHPGAEGVTVFFVLSGYLISRLLLAELDRAERVDLRRFYVRRAARLLPALVCVLAMLPLLIWVTGGRAASALADVALSGLYLMDFAVAGGRVGPLGHTWSLAVEEQFYLVWPLLLILLVRRRWDVTRTLTVLLAAAVAWRTVATVGFDFTRVYFAPDTNAYALLVGCLLASLERDGRLPTWSARTGKMAALALVVPVLLPGWDGVLWGSVAAAALAGVMTVSARTAEPGLLTWPALRWFGQISYGLYLWHSLLLNAYQPTLSGRVVLVATSVGIAWLSWRFIELPIMAWAKGRGSAQPVEPADRPGLEAARVGQVDGRDRGGVLPVLTDGRGEHGTGD